MDQALVEVQQVAVIGTLYLMAAGASLAILFTTDNPWPAFACAAVGFVVQVLCGKATGRDR